MVTEPVQALAAIAAHGLEGASEASISVDRESWRSLAGSLERERLTGLAALLHGRDVLRLDPESAEDLSALDASWAQHTLRAEDVMLEVAERLRVEGVAFRVLKGTALAELGWRWGEARRWVDADVLVPGDRIDEVVRWLEQAGAQRHVPALRPGFDRRFAKSVTLRSAAGPEIDLHRTLVLGPHTFLVDRRDLWAAPRRFEVEGAPLATTSAEVTLVHLCMHATIAGTSRLASLRDVVEAARGCDLDAAGEVAARWKARPAVVLAGEAVALRLGLPEHDVVAWARSLQPSAEERRIASVYEPGVRGARNLAMAGLRHVPGVLDKVRYAAALALPSAANRTARRRSVSEQLRRIRPRRRGPKP